MMKKVVVARATKLARHLVVSLHEVGERDGWRKVYVQCYMNRQRALDSLLLLFNRAILQPLGPSRYCSFGKLNSLQAVSEHDVQIDLL
jgi:hypothetical protein